uniref:Uncharacterized protein n=1 Tax=Fusarium oxysporum (strain Fo5176) TaxID=660025 RepID=A0A0D2Y6M3_FUSOF
MTSPHNPTVLIRAEELKQPQFLYWLDKQELHEFKNYSHFTDPSSILSSSYDYILITIDAKSVQSEEGEELVKIIGQAARDKTTKKADVAYVDSMGNGFILEDYVPSISSSFSKLYNACGVSNCVIWSSTQCALNIFPLFAVFIGLELLGWPKIKDIDTESEVWRLTTAAAKEVQMLDVCGEAGTQTAQATSESTFVQMFAYLEEKLRPLDFQAFNQFHHGGKVVEQYRMHIERCISQGVAEGKPMSALKTLLQNINH